LSDQVVELIGGGAKCAGLVPGAARDAVQRLGDRFCLRKATCPEGRHPKSFQAPGIDTQPIDIEELLY